MRVCQNKYKKEKAWKYFKKSKGEFHDNPFQFPIANKLITGCYITDGRQLFGGTGFYNGIVRFFRLAISIKQQRIVCSPFDGPIV